MSSQIHILPFSTHKPQLALEELAHLLDAEGLPIPISSQMHWPVPFLSSQRPQPPEPEVSETAGSGRAEKVVPEAAERDGDDGWYGDAGDSEREGVASRADTVIAVASSCRWMYDCRTG